MLKWPVWDSDLQSFVIVGPDGWPVYGASAGECDAAYAEHLARLNKNPDADLWRAMLAEEQVDLRYPLW